MPVPAVPATVAIAVAHPVAASNLARGNGTPLLKHGQPSVNAMMVTDAIVLTHPVTAAHTDKSTLPVARKAAAPVLVLALALVPFLVKAQALALVLVFPAAVAPQDAPAPATGSTQLPAGH